MTYKLHSSTSQGLKDQRHAVATKMKRLHNVAAEEKRSLSATEQAEWDTLTREVKQLDIDIRAQEAKETRDVEEALDPNTFSIDNEADMERFRRNGRTNANFVTSSGNIRSLRSDESFAAATQAAGWIKSRSRNRPWMGEDPSHEIVDLSLGDFLRALACGPRNQIEERALSEGVDASGGFTVPDILSAKWIDAIRRQSVVIRAGAQTVPLNSDRHSFAVLSADPTPAWRNEAASVTEDDPTFAQKTFVPRSLAVLTRMSAELLEDSLNAGEILQHSMTQALSLELDRVALFGSGTPPEPTGAINTASVTSFTYVGANSLVDNMLELLEDLAIQNVTPNAVVLAPKQRKTLDQAKDLQDHPLWEMAPSLKPLPHFVTTAIPDDASMELFISDWTKLAIGMRHGISIVVLRERYADTMQIGFLAHLRADIVVWHPQSIGVLAAIT